MATTKVLLTGAAGYIASQMLPTFWQRYDLTLVDITQQTRQGETMTDIVVLGACSYAEPACWHSDRRFSAVGSL